MTSACRVSLRLVKLFFCFMHMFSFMIHLVNLKTFWVQQGDEGTVTAATAKCAGHCNRRGESKLYQVLKSVDFFHSFPVKMGQNGFHLSLQKKSTFREVYWEVFLTFFHHRDKIF